MGGQTSIRPFWRCYFLTAAALVFVVDACDTERLDLAKHELHMLLEEEGLEDVVLMVFANKQDLPKSMSITQLTEALDLTNIKNRQWSIFGTSALTGSGINEGLDWLCNELSRR